MFEISHNLLRDSSFRYAAFFASFKGLHCIVPTRLGSYWFEHHHEAIPL